MVCYVSGRTQRALLAIDNGHRSDGKAITHPDFNDLSATTATHRPGRRRTTRVS